MNKRLLVSSEVKAEHYDQTVLLSFTKKRKEKKKSNKNAIRHKRSRCFWQGQAAKMWPPLSTSHPSWLSPHWFARFLLLFCVCFSYMDSPLSRSPGSSVLIGVGLPMTLPSSPLGGPHRLEYCWTPPQSNSPPVLFPHAPRLLLLLLLAPLLLLFQWGEWPMGWEAPDPAPPILFWLVPGVACQLVVPPSDWPCAKKRFTSSSPANSARMVVFPSTHLDRDGKNQNPDGQCLSSLKYQLWYLVDIHVQGLLSFGSFILGAVAHHGISLCQV